MRTTRGRRWLAVGALLAGSAVAADRGGLAAAAGVDVWNVPALEDRIATARRADVRIDEARDEVADRLAVKDVLVADLVAGRATLAETAGRFERLNRDNPELLAELRRRHPAACDRELAARNVLDHAASHRAAPPAATRRLAAEFALLFPAVAPPARD